MTDELLNRVAKITNIHCRISDAGSGIDPYREWACECGSTWQTGVSHAVHLADAVIAELGLREEMRYPGGTFSFTPPQRRRYVTDWVTDE